MLYPDDPDEMTPEERQAEVASILAAGFLRLKKRDMMLPDGISAETEPSEETEKGSRN